MRISYWVSDVCSSDLLEFAFARWKPKRRPGRRTLANQLAIDPHLRPIVGEELGEASIDDAIGIAHMQRNAEGDERAAAAAEAVVGWRTHQEIEGRAILDRRIAARGPDDEHGRARIQNRNRALYVARPVLQRLASAAGRTGKAAAREGGRRDEGR